MTAETDLYIPQGTTWSQSWQIINYDLTGTTWTGRSQVRRTADSEDVLHDLAVTLDEDILTVSVLPEESSAWPWKTGVYDVEIEAADGRVLRVVQGGVYVSREVTRD